MDKCSGKIITPAKYYNFSAVSRDLVLAQLERWSDERVVMDLKGNTVKNR